MYKELNDYEIIYMVKENDDNFPILYEKYHPLIKKYAYHFINCFKPMGYDIDDLIQIGNLVLYRTMNYYSMVNNNMYYTYLNRAIINAYRQEYRRCNTLCYKALNNYISYDSLVPNTDYSYLEIIGYNDDKPDFSQFINFKNSLSFDDSSILELRINGYSNKEISCLLNIKEYLIKKRISVIKKMMIYM